MIYGLAAALVWGGADFGGGLASRRTALYGVVLISQLAGMALSLGIAWFRSEVFPTGTNLVVCLVAGVIGGIGVTMLYRALAIGRMAIVAPVTGVLAAVIPVVAGFATEGIPAPLVLAGIVVAIVAVILVSRVAGEAGGRAGLTEALVAGVTIGLFGVVIAQLGDGNVFSALTVIRCTQAVVVVAVVVATRSAWRLPGTILPAVVLIGILDMAGNTFYLFAVQTGQLAVASVLSALYPVATVVLAAFFLHERVTRVHIVGIVLAGLAIVLIGLGSG